MIDETLPAPPGDGNAMAAGTVYSHSVLLYKQEGSGSMSDLVYGKLRPFPCLDSVEEVR
jgi:hypothetical protein